jgi:hypothetical protein
MFTPACTNCATMSAIVEVTSSNLSQLNLNSACSHPSTSDPLSIDSYVAIIMYMCRTHKGRREQRWHVQLFYKQTQYYGQLSQTLIQCIHSYLLCCVVFCVFCANCASYLCPFRCHFLIKCCDTGSIEINVTRRTLCTINNSNKQKRIPNSAVPTTGKPHAVSVRMNCQHNM